MTRPWVLAARNVVKALLLLGGFVAALTALGWWLGDVKLASVFLVVGLLMAATVLWYGPRVVLASLGARELPIAEAPSASSTATHARRSQRSRYSPEANSASVTAG